MTEEAVYWNNSEAFQGFGCSRSCRGLTASAPFLQGAPAVLKRTTPGISAQNSR
jgi:hypothetical protein